MNKFIVFISIFLLNNSVLAVSKIQIMFVKGNVIYEKMAVSETIKVKKGMSLPLGGVLQTSKDALVIAKLEDSWAQHTFKLDQKGKFKLGIPKSKKSVSNVSLLLGELFVKVKRLKDGKNKVLNIKAKSVSMGVRGTILYTGISLKNGKEDLWMCVNKGLVELKDKSRTQNVKAGEGIFVAGGVKASDAKPYPWTKNLNWNFDENKGDVVNSVKIEDAYGESDDEYDF